MCTSNWLDSGVSTPWSAYGYTHEHFPWLTIQYYDTNNHQSYDTEPESWGYGTTLEQIPSTATGTEKEFMGYHLKTAGKETDDGKPITLRVEWAGLDVNNDGVNECEAGSSPDGSTENIEWISVEIKNDSMPKLQVNTTASMNGEAISQDAILHVGDVVDYSIEVQNVGTADCENDVLLTDDLLGFTSSNPKNLGVLSQGEKKTITQSYTVTDIDVTAGKISSIANASTKFKGGYETTKTLISNESKFINSVNNVAIVANCRPAN